MAKKPKTVWDEIKDELTPGVLEYLLKRHHDLLAIESAEVYVAIGRPTVENVRRALRSAGFHLDFYGTGDGWKWEQMGKEKNKEGGTEERVQASDAAQPTATQDHPLPDAR
jgi:hypothetical protein